MESPLKRFWRYKSLFALYRKDIENLSPPSFEKIPYEPFVPRAQIINGRKVITRSGVVLFDWIWTRRSTYSGLLVIWRVSWITIFSILRRGIFRAPDEQRIAVIHSLWTKGYYHWITEGLPRAIVVRNVDADAIPLLPTKEYEGYVQSLEALGFSKVAFSQYEKNLSVLNPLVTECARNFGTTDPALLRDVRQKVWSGLGIKLSDRAEQPRIIYVSRSMARGRRVLNEDDVVRSLTRWGVTLVNFEELSFSDQVKLMSKTDVLVSIHGAALANMTFMPEGGAALELLPRRNGIFDYSKIRRSFRHDSCYVRLAAAMGHKHYAFESAVDSKWNSSTHMANVFVDIERLDTIMEKIVDEYSQG